MLSESDLAAVRAIVHEELARARRHRVHPAAPAPAGDPWLAMLRDTPPAVATAEDGRRYVTIAGALSALELAPTVWLPLFARRVHVVLLALGYHPGPRVRPAGRAGPRVTPYYPTPARVWTRPPRLPPRDHAPAALARGHVHSETPCSVGFGARWTLWTRPPPPPEHFSGPRHVHTLATPCHRAAEIPLSIYLA